MRDYLYNLATDKYKGLVPAIIKIFLSILSLIYGLMVKFLYLFYCIRPYRLNCKVISVGNITLGGTGKTLLVNFIARYLKQQGHKVAILSRGYKKKATNFKLQTLRWEVMGDEPFMLKMNLKDVPVIVDANRIQAGNHAIREYGVDTVILDDGFQQWTIKKDLEIVTIDATRPFGNRHLLPRGILRESLSSLRRADVFVLTKTNLNPDVQDIKDFLSSLNLKATIFESIHKSIGFYRIDNTQELLSPDIFKGKTVTLFSGIGSPDSFENLIISLGMNIGLSFRFLDHHYYTQQDLDRIIKESQIKNIDTVITTEKDAVRLDTKSFVQSPLSIFVLCIELKIVKNEQEFHNRLLRLYSL